MFCLYHVLLSLQGWFRFDDAIIFIFFITKDDFPQNFPIVFFFVFLSTDCLRHFHGFLFFNREGR